MLLDGYQTHYSLQFIHYAVSHNIILIPYPGHSTHLLQPLDVASFAPLQSAYGSAVATHTCTTRTGVNKALFYKPAKHEAYTKSNIKSAWHATGIRPFNPDKVLAKLEKKVKNTKQLPLPASTPQSFKFLKTPQNRQELRQQTIAAIDALESGEKESSIQLLRRMAPQTDAAWTRAELADIENEDIKARYTSKMGPRGGRQKMTKAQVVDGESVTKKETEFQEKEQKVEGKAKARAARARSKAQNDSVTGKGKGKAGESSKSAKQTGKEVIYDPLLLHIFAYFNDIYRGLLW